MADTLRADCIKKIGNKHFYIFDDPIKDGIRVEPRNIEEGGRDMDRVHTARDCPSYRRADDSSLKKVDTETLIKELVPKLKGHIDVEKLLEDVLSDQSVGDLEEIHERVVKPAKEPSIKQKPGCMFLSIGGKPGQPHNLFLRY